MVLFLTMNTRFHVGLLCKRNLDSDAKTVLINTHTHTQQEVLKTKAVSTEEENILLFE